MLISSNRIKKILYYIKKGRFNVIINAVRLYFFYSFSGGLFSGASAFSPGLNAPTALAVPVFPGTTLVSIIIPAYNQWNYTYACIKSILENTEDVNYEIIVADDNSSDDTVNIKKYVKNFKLIRNEVNLGFLKNCNNAAKYASGKYLLFLNNDTKVKKSWLKNLLCVPENDENVGMAGPKFIYPNGVLLEAGGIIWKDGETWQYGRFDSARSREYNRERETDYVSGACLMIRKDLFDRIGGFDERFAPAYYEDADIALEAKKAGYKVVYQPASVVIHYENITYGHKKGKKWNKNNNYEENKKRFIEKWRNTLEEKHFKHMEDASSAVYGPKGERRYERVDNDAASKERCGWNAFNINRVLIECSDTYLENLNTGIQRVVRNIAGRSAVMREKSGVPVIPIVLDNDKSGYLELKLNNIGRHNDSDGDDDKHKLRHKHNYNETGGYGNRNGDETHRGFKSTGERIKIILKEKFKIKETGGGFKFFKIILHLLKKFKYFCVGLIQIYKSGLNRSHNIENAKDTKGEPVFPEENDLLILADGFWNYPYNIYFDNFCKKIKKNGGIIIAVIYDIIPLTEPEFFEIDLVARFKSKVNKFNGLIDGIVTISKSEKEIIEEYLRKRLNIQDKPVAYFYLGCDIKLRRKNRNILSGNEENNREDVACAVAGVTGYTEINEGVRKAVKKIAGLKVLPPQTSRLLPSMQLRDTRLSHLPPLPAKLYLMVGTIEPRKGYGYAVEAFEDMWKTGWDGILIIAGKIGWKVDELIEKIRRSEYLDKKLFIFNDLSDEELCYFYNNADALIFSSLREGFGLPLVEAMNYRLPVIASDIPVFREIAGDKNYPIMFFYPDKNGLINAVNKFEDKPFYGDNPDKTIEGSISCKTSPNRLITWDESVNDFSDAVFELLKIIRRDTKNSEAHPENKSLTAD